MNLSSKKKNLTKEELNLIKSIAESTVSSFHLEGISLSFEEAFKMAKKSFEKHKSKKNK